MTSSTQPTTKKNFTTKPLDKIMRGMIMLLVVTRKKNQKKMEVETAASMKKKWKYEKHDEL